MKASVQERNPRLISKQYITERRWLTNIQTDMTANTGVSIGSDLNYTFNYEYEAGTHRASSIGNRQYRYDQNGNLSAEREGSFSVADAPGTPVYQEGNVYSTAQGYGLTRPAAGGGNEVYQRNYVWNERNLLRTSKDNRYTVQYRYGADGQRAIKYTEETNRTALYFNTMWQMGTGEAGWRQSKHIYVGESRVATKRNYEEAGHTQTNLTDETHSQYWYHSDHLGSAQLVTDWQGNIYERLEYTPYGEIWIERWAQGIENTPYRFTGKELDSETGLYYYGARYLDPKTSRWLSGDPALGDYLPSAPINDEAKKRNGILPGQGGVFNLVNLHVYHYAGNNPVKYTDPDGNEIVKFAATFNMSDYSLSNLGNSSNEKISQAGCYITTFANIGHELQKWGKNNDYAGSHKGTLGGINSLKSIFASGSGSLAGRDVSMNRLFGEGNWDYFTKAGQADKGGLGARLQELDASGQKYMIAGIFDLSSVDANVPNHMVGITGLPGADGVFAPSSLVVSSNGDKNRLNNDTQRSGYNINNLKEIRVILIE